MVDGAVVVDSGVLAEGVVPGFDPFEQCHGELAAVRPLVLFK